MIRIKVKEVAQQKGIGQGKLARMADMDMKTLRRIYKDPFVDISLYTLDKLAIALEVNASVLIESVEEPLK